MRRVPYVLGSFVALLVPVVACEPPRGGRAAGDGSEAPPFGPSTTPSLVVEASGDHVTENGAPLTLKVRLGSEPPRDVVVSVTPSDPDEGTPSVRSLTFPRSKWNEAQTLEVRPVDDAVIDGAKRFSLVLEARMSRGELYAKRTLELRNDDDDAARLVPAVSSLDVQEGDSQELFFALGAKPKAPVTVRVTTSEKGVPTRSFDVVVEPEAYAKNRVFVDTQENREADGPRDGTVSLAVVSSGDADFAGAEPAKVALRIRDDDQAGFDLSGAILEEGHAAGNRVTVFPWANPKAPVKLTLRLPDGVRGTVEPPSATIGLGQQYAAFQVKVEDDGLITGLRDVKLLADIESNDAAYAALRTAELSARLFDTDFPGLRIVDGDPSWTAEEGAAAAKMTVALGAKPTGVVEVAVTMTDSAQAEVSPSVLKFTPADWAVPRTVSVRGIADDLLDGDRWVHAWLKVRASEDPRFRSALPRRIPFSVRDVQAHRITLPAPWFARETGEVTKASVLVRFLDGRSVTVALRSERPDQVEVLTPEVTGARGEMPTFELRALRDDVDEGDVDVPLTMEVVRSDDPELVGVKRTIPITVLDRHEHYFERQVLAEIPGPTPCALTASLGYAVGVEAGTGLRSTVTRTSLLDGSRRSLTTDAPVAAPGGRKELCPDLAEDGSVALFGTLVFDFAMNEVRTLPVPSSAPLVRESALAADGRHLAFLAGEAGRDEATLFTMSVDGRTAAPVRSIPWDAVSRRSLAVGPGASFVAIGTARPLDDGKQNVPNLFVGIGAWSGSARRLTASATGLELPFEGLADHRPRIVGAGRYVFFRAARSVLGLASPLESRFTGQWLAVGYDMTTGARFDATGGSGAELADYPEHRFVVASDGTATAYAEEASPHVLVGAPLKGQWRRSRIAALENAVLLGVSSEGKSLFYLERPKDGPARVVRLSGP